MPSIATYSPEDMWVPSLPPSLPRLNIKQPTLKSQLNRNTLRNSSRKTFRNYLSILNGAHLSLTCNDCAYVTSSGQLLQSNAGREIDKHECVIRMNDAPVIGHETDVGRRTTIRSMSFINVLQSLEHNADKRNEFLADNRTKTEIFLLNWMTELQINIFEDVYFRYAILLAHLYPAVKFYRFTTGKIGESRRLFYEHVGKGKMKELHHKEPSTGWHTMVAAIELCGQVTVYGMVPPSFCPLLSNATTPTHTSEIPESSEARAKEDVPYHYYHPNAWTDECEYLTLSERAKRKGHPFITEREVIKKLMRKHNITFRHPYWTEMP